jgi:hypothetical protein
LNCVGLWDVIVHNNRNAEAMSSVIIAVIVLIVGFYGSYHNRRTYLIGFALILIIAIIVGFVSNVAIYYSLGFSIAVAVLALAQSELLRRSF